MRSGSSVALALFFSITLFLVSCGQEARPTPLASTPGPADTAKTQEQLPKQGETLYQANCLRCHGGATGGSMTDIPPRHNANGHTWHHPDCQLVQTVLRGSGQMGEMMRQMMGASQDTPRMPAFQGVLTEEEIRAILAHIKSWWTPDQREFQARATRQVCRQEPVAPGSS